MRKNRTQRGDTIVQSILLSLPVIANIYLNRRINKKPCLSKHLDYALMFPDLEGGKFFFNTVREGDSVLFATEDEQVNILRKDIGVKDITLGVGRKF